VRSDLRRCVGEGSGGEGEGEASVDALGDVEGE
jgi:hypothetical protein